MDMAIDSAEWSSEGKIVVGPETDMWEAWAEVMEDESWCVPFKPEGKEGVSGDW